MRSRQSAPPHPIHSAPPVPSPCHAAASSFSSDYCSNQLEDHSIDRAEFIRVATRKAVRLPENSVMA